MKGEEIAMIKEISAWKRIVRQAIGWISPSLLATIDVYRNMNYIIDLKNPSDLNEKILWLSLHSDTTKWSELADKYEVRNYIKEKGYEDILVKLYGVYDDISSINYETLPQSFILKTNHGSGTNIIVNDKSQLDIQRTNILLNKWMKMTFGWPKEPHYSRIKPKIIAEELLKEEINSDLSASLIDYKIFCLNGNAKCILVCFNRGADSVYLENYFVDWSYHPETEVFSNRYRNGGGIIPKPVNLERMIKAAEDLAAGFPQVRVDFYEVNKKLYFGELTFTSDTGCMVYFTREFLQEMGQEVSLDWSK